MRVCCFFIFEIRERLWVGCSVCLFVRTVTLKQWHKVAQICNRQWPWYVLEMIRFWGRKVKGQGVNKRIFHDNSERSNDPKLLRFVIGNDLSMPGFGAERQGHGVNKYDYPRQQESGCGQNIQCEWNLGSVRLFNTFTWCCLASCSTTISLLDWMPSELWTFSWC